MGRSWGAAVLASGHLARDDLRVSDYAPDAGRCPSCGEPIAGRPVCPSCGLTLQGPLAAELWDVDVRIGALRAHRDELIDRLRRGGTHAPAAPVAPVAPAPMPWPGAPEPPLWSPSPRKEWTPQRIQNTLLSLGVLLLAVAALVATAVAYRQVGATGRALVMLLVTALAVVASSLSRRRGLQATAEATAVLAVVLALVDAHGLRTAGFADGVGARSYWTAATAVVALGSGLLAVRGARAFGWGAALVGQVPLLVTASRQDGAAVSGVLTAQVAMLTAAAWGLRRIGGAVELQVVVLVCGALTAVGSAGVAADAAYPEAGQVHAGVAALVALALTLVVAAVALTELADGRHALTFAATALLLLALAAPARLAFSASELAAVVAVSALMLAVGCSVLPRAWQLGPAAGAAGGAVAALLLVGTELAQVVLGPFTWLSSPWSRAAGASAREAVSTTEAWTGQGVIAVVVLVSAVTGLALGMVARRVALSGGVVAALCALAVVVVPLAADTTYPVAVTWDAAVAVAALLLGPSLRRRTRVGGYALSSLGAAVLVLACGWSTADERTSTVVLAAAAVACAVAAWLDGLLDAALAPPLVGMATALCGAEVFAVARSAGAPVDRSGFLLAVTGCLLLVALGRLRPGTLDGVVAEVTSGALVAAGLVATATDPGWTSWALALAGLAALAVAVRPERRAVGYVGALLLAASSWVRLADAHVHAPEPYVVPLAAVAVGLGLLRRRGDHTLGSWTAYGPALTLGLLPSLVASLDDSSARRPLLLAVAATAVVVVGAVRRLQAPLVIGAGVLAVDAVRQLGAYVALLPRWVVIATLGLILLLLGTTFEQRRRDLQRAQDAFRSLS